jgi:hypothetical protein
MSRTTSSTAGPAAGTGAADAVGRGRGRPPLWAIELLDVAGRRGPFALWLATVLSAGLLIVATFAPWIVPAGGAVGTVVAATSLAVAGALALALDALDVRVRGPRHIRSCSGELVALLPDAPRETDAEDLATAVLEAAPRGTTLHLGLAPVGSDITSMVGWTAALAAALARTGASVLLVDLASPDQTGPGVLEVVRDRVPLADAVVYTEGLPLASIGPGADRLGALQALITLPTLVPDDVDVLLVALPPIVNRSAVNASRILDQVLFIAEANLTSRVELMAALDALRVAGCAPQVVLLDGGTYHLLRGDQAPVVRERANVPLAPIPLEGPATVAVITPPVPPVASAAAVPTITSVSGAASRGASPDASAGDGRPSGHPTEDAGHGADERDGRDTDEVPVVVPDMGDEGVAVSAAEMPSPPAVTVASAAADEVSAPMRTVDVLEAAAAARAETVIEAGLVDTVPMTREEVAAQLAAPPLVRPRPPVTPQDRVPAPGPPEHAPASAPVSTPPPAPAPAVSAPAQPPTSAPARPAPSSEPVTTAADDELTAELAAATARLPDWADVAEEEDLLRTTVQLSVFADELDLRDDH